MNRVLVVMGVVFAVALALFAFGVSSLVLQLAVPLVADGNIAFLFGAALIVAVAAAAVSIAGTNVVRGIPFHILGVLGPFTIGSVVEPLRELIALGPLIYLATWCWAFLGESAFRLIQSRRHPPAPPQQED